jgi:hypothetical protein
MRFGKSVVAALAVSALVAPAVLAGDRSGPKVGSSIQAFHVDDITGPNKGKSLCYV